MYLENQDEINEAKERYLHALNRVNLLLVKEHDLRRDESLYEKELSDVEKIIENIKSGDNHQRTILAQDEYLRNLVKKNAQEIKNKEKVLKGQEIMNDLKQIQALHEKYLQMMSPEFREGIQQKLSMIRGKVDQLKKKIKELNKQILSFENEHLQEIDDYSLNLKNLELYISKNEILRKQIHELKGKR